RRPPRSPGRPPPPTRAPRAPRAAPRESRARGPEPPRNEPPPESRDRAAPPPPPAPRGPRRRHSPRARAGRRAGCAPDRNAQRDEHLTPVGQPAGVSRLPKPLVRHLDAAEVPLNRFVLRRALDRIGRFVKLPPDGGPLVRSRMAQLVHPVLAFEVAQEADHLVIVGDGPLIREAHQERRAARPRAVTARPADLEAPGADGQRPRTQLRQPARQCLAPRQRERVVPDLVA